jgi:hypothetical protein
LVGYLSVSTRDFSKSIVKGSKNMQQKRVLTNLLKLFPGLALVVISLTISSAAYAQGHTSYVAQVSQIEYTAEVRGNLNGQLQFAHRATLKLNTTFNPGGGHPFDICLLTDNNPVFAPLTGAISLHSNSQCFPGARPQVDMGSVTYDEQEKVVKLQVDPGTSALSFNCFNTSSGVTGGLQIIVTGGMVLQFSEDGQTFKGVIEVIGNSSAYSPTQGDRYNAVIVGRLNG